MCAGMVLVWRWHGFGMVLVWFGMVWYGFGIELIWYGYDFGMILV